MGEYQENVKFLIDYRSDGVYFTVPNPNSSSIKIEDVMMTIMRKKVKEYNRKAIENVLCMRTSTSTKIAPFQNEEPIDAVAVVALSDDKMKATIKVYPPEGGRNLTFDNINAQLNASGIKFGVKSEAIALLLNNPEYNKPMIIAEGRPFKNGKNAKIEYKFDINPDRRPTINENGAVNLKELNYVQSVVAGQILCECIPHTLGIDGMDVTGKELKSVSGKPAIFPRGKNVDVTEDKMYLVSRIDGGVQFTDHKVNVFSVFEVAQDVDISTGNITFVGSVHVKGMVTDGFTIEAQGNIEVEGFVEAATLRAGGDIILHRGISGKVKGVLVAGNDIIAKYIENCSVEAKNNILADVVMHSKVKCGDKLTLKGKKGLLVGGHVIAGNEISAKVIGSYMSTATELEVGVDPYEKERLNELREEITRQENELKKTEQVIVLLNKLIKLGQLSAEKQETLVKAEKTSYALTESLQILTEEFEETSKKLKEEADKGRVKVGTAIYPGTRISIKTASLQIRDAMKVGTFYKSGEDIRFGVY